MPGSKTHGEHDGSTACAPAGEDTPGEAAPVSALAPARRFGSGSLAHELIAGRYQVLGVLGSGGMGTVLRVRDLELDEVVALKVIHRELLAVPDALQRIRHEVKLARRVSHPGVARTFDIGGHEGERFLTMELVDGASLAEELAERGPLSALRCCQLGIAVAEALVAAHEAGVVHGDLSPANILLARSGRVLVTDFGVAAAVALAAGSEGGNALGTPAYMAPEQVRGARAIDGRADIYALGAVLFEACTGERPWLGPSKLAVAAARLVEPTPDPRERNSAVPASLARVVMACLARAPADRFQSAELVAHALGSAAAREATSAAGDAHVEHAAADLGVRHPGDGTVLVEEPALAAEDMPLIDAVTLELFLRGLHEYRRFWPDNLQRALHLFERALVRSGGAPPMLAGLSMACARHAHFTGQGLPEARRAAEEARARAPELAEARLAMALVLFEEGDAVGAAVEVRAAMARGPALPEAHLLLGRTLVETGRIDNGVERLRAAGALGGGDLGVPELARALALSGQASRAHALLERGPPSSWAGAGASSDAQAPAAAPEATPPVPDVSLRVERARLAVWARDAAWGERWLADVSLPVPARGPLAIVFALAELCARGADPRAHPEFSAPPLVGPRARRRAFLEQIHAEICASRGDVGGAVGAVARSAAAGLCDIAWLDRCPLLEEARIDPAFRAAAAEVRRAADAVHAALVG